MPSRNNYLVTGNIYHVFSKSIAGFKIFNSKYEFDRMIKTISFYRTEDTPCKLSTLLRPTSKHELGNCGSVDSRERIVEILAYCLMPTHIHLLLKQLKENGISRFMYMALKSYSKFFNAKYKRKGPLWEGRFKCVSVDTDEYFLHLTRYIHLNPVTAFLVNNPKDWEFSSYREYAGLIDNQKKVCNYCDYLDMQPDSYASFVLDQVDCQRELAKIKHLLCE